MAIKRSGAFEFGRALSQALMGRRGQGTSPAKPKRDQTGLPPPPPRANVGQFVQNQLQDITPQAMEEEGDQAQIMGQQMNRLQGNVDDSAATIHDEAILTQRANEFQHAQNQQAIQDQQSQVQQLPGQIQQASNQALQGFKDYASQNIQDQQGMMDSIMGDVGRGQSMAMEAAVQGSQATINNQISQINANPNIPPSQKQQMINQVRMQGSMQMGPIIGSTILEFNKLQATTATTLANQLAGMRQSATEGVRQLEGAGLGAVSDAYTTAHTLGSQLTQLSVNDRNQYMADRQQINTARWAAENSNNQIGLAMMPQWETTVPMYSDIMIDALGANVQAMQIDSAELNYRYGMQLTTMQAQMAQMNQRFNTLQGIMGLVPGPMGIIGSAAVGVLGAAQPNPAPQPGWY